MIFRTPVPHERRNGKSLRAVKGRLGKFYPGHCPLDVQLAKGGAGAEEEPSAKRQKTGGDATASSAQPSCELDEKTEADIKEVLSSHHVA